MAAVQEISWVKKNWKCQWSLNPGVCTYANFLDWSSQTRAAAALWTREKSPFENNMVTLGTFVFRPHIPVIFYAPNCYLVIIASKIWLFLVSAVGVVLNTRRVMFGGGGGGVDWILNLKLQMISKINIQPSLSTSGRATCVCVVFLMLYQTVMF